MGTKTTGQEFDEHEFEAATRRGMEADIKEARAVSVDYRPDADLLIVGLRGGATLTVECKLLQGVAGATPEKIAAVEITPRGNGLHWEELDADLLVQDLAAGCFGTRAWMKQLVERGALDEASRRRQEMIRQLYHPDEAASTSAAAALGHKGGQARTAAKSAAARENGKKGGRPRRVVK